jgi:hypothetical protein
MGYRGAWECGWQRMQAQHWHFPSNHASQTSPIQRELDPWIRGLTEYGGDGGCRRQQATTSGIYGRSSRRDATFVFRLFRYTLWSSVCRVEFESLFRGRLHAINVVTTTSGVNNATRGAAWWPLTRSLLWPRLTSDRSRKKSEKYTIANEEAGRKSLLEIRQPTGTAFRLATASSMLA